MKNKGLAIHCHHDKLIEHCYDYDERVQYIKDDKPRNEIPIRLLLFKFLTEEAVSEIPIEWQKAHVKWQRASNAWDKEEANFSMANAAWDKAESNWAKAEYAWLKARAKLIKANFELPKADDEWSLKSQKIFHKKWCGCEYWKNGELKFN